ncbi:methyltransferase [Fragilaria crotonensis]|nr:methyltransferase [Fragilaria crotonensis]
MAFGRSFLWKIRSFGKEPSNDVPWFSQARQDEVVSRLLRGKRNGFFVDLAANDAAILSNTYSLEKKFGWTGLCIEPNPIYWANLTYRECQVVAAVVGKERMEEVLFRFDNGDHGGIVGDGFDNGKRHGRVSDPRYTVTLKEILERFNAPELIDYLSLDVEGAEEFIIKEFPLTKYKVSLMTIERPKEPLRALLDQNGYKFVKRLSTWGETLWAHESITGALDLSILDEFTPTKKPKSSIEVIQK